MIGITSYYCVILNRVILHDAIKTIQNGVFVFLLKNKNLFFFKKNKTPGFEKKQKNPDGLGFLKKLGFFSNLFIFQSFFVIFP